jgi:hypothetical protein
MGRKHCLHIRAACALVYYSSNAPPPAQPELVELPEGVFSPSPTRWFRHRSEQYFTLSQHLLHFLRQVNGLLQVAQTFDGRLDFVIVFIAFIS